MMIKLARGVGAATFGVLALAGAAAAQGYPPYSAQPNPAQPYPAQQQPYPAQPYPAQPYPAQSYPAQGRPGYPGQGYPAQGYPAQGAPVQPAQASNPVCVRLEAQLASIDSNASDPNRAAQIKRTEDAIAKQQADLDRTLAQAHRVGCAGQGFFSLFSGLSPQCGPLNTQIQQMRGNLDRMMSDLEQLKSGSSDRQAQHQAVIAQLAQNNCGAQYTAAARASGPQGFFEALLGGGTIVSPGGDGAPAGTYRTVCVRTCDGYYFPVSYSTVPSRFADDDRACHRLCPAADVMLFSYRNPGEEITQAVSVNGQQYTALPNAFRYRKELVSSCSCKRPGENWAEALRGADDSTTLENSDIVVNEKNEKALTQPRGTNGKPLAGGAPANATPVPAAQPQVGEGTPAQDAKGRKVRVVGPPFISAQ
jgi:uncharacterized protein DUF2865